MNLTCRPWLSQLKRLFEAQTKVGNTGSRYMDLTPYPGLPAPIVISSWGYQLRVTSPTDPRLQRFVNTFRASPTYTPNTAVSAPEG